MEMSWKLERGTSRGYIQSVLDGVGWGEGLGEGGGRAEEYFEGKDGAATE